MSLMRPFMSLLAVIPSRNVIHNILMTFTNFLSDLKWVLLVVIKS